ncbi:MAG: hypothetical protein QOF78_2956 [Phycisphaerales bacterium]|jgi:hypothetical protein|nr:hypothetical protein [Phycisphaerales bacterium]
MHPIVFFVIILVVIWVLSAIASAVSKQQEVQRRRQFRELMDQPQGQAVSRRPPPPPPLHPAYAIRHPEMTAPPSQSSQPQRARVQMPAPQAVPQQRLQPKQQPRRPRPAVVGPRRAPAMALPPPIPVLQADDAPPARATAQGAKPVAAKRPAAKSATAPTISRWLQPATLRQQFILTEVFQPPLGMRAERLG